jgi:fatty-acid desaturase
MMVGRTELPLDWRNIFLLTLVHVVALVGTPVYLFFHGLSLAAALIGLVLTAMTIFSISAGYHRLFSHRAYEAHPVLRFLLLVFGAGAFQNTALAWAADHRRHHGRTISMGEGYHNFHHTFPADYRNGVGLCQFDVAAQYEARRAEASSHAREAMSRLRAEFRAAGRDLRAAYASWKRGAGSLTGTVVWDA